MANAKIYQVEAISADFLHRVRTQGVDDLGQAVEYLEAAGGEPCRDALRVARPGERLILASYSPFTKTGPYREFGPVFVLANQQAEAVHLHSIPIDSELAYFRNPVALRGYCADERIVSARLSPVAEIEKHMLDMLHSAAIKSVHIRFGAYGCFACKVTLKTDDDSVF